MELDPLVGIRFCRRGNTWNSALSRLRRDGRGATEDLSLEYARSRILSVGCKIILTFIQSSDRVRVAVRLSQYTQYQRVSHMLNLSTLMNIRASFLSLRKNDRDRTDRVLSLEPRAPGQNL